MPATGLRFRLFAGNWKAPVIYWGQPQHSFCLRSTSDEKPQLKMLTTQINLKQGKIDVKSSHKITGAELAKLIIGKTLTVPDMHALLRKAHPGYDPESLWVALRVLKGSTNCVMDMSLRDQHRAYCLRSVSQRFYERSAAVTGRSAESKSRMPVRFNETELAYINRFNEFDRLLRAARTH